MPLPSREELNALVATDVKTAIPPTSLLPILTSAPFVPSRSLINLRDIGATPGSALVPGRAFRSGTLDFAAKDPDATAWLSGHVKRIFDLRGADERALAPDPEFAGIENVWLEAQGEYPAPQLPAFVADRGSHGWKQQLLSVALVLKPSIRAILEHVRDRPTEPYLFHCTGGRDRTGVVAGLLQHLAGTQPDDIVFDYMLSRLGIEPAREKMLQFAMAGVGVTDIETPGFLNLISLRPEFWTAFVGGIEEKYGGWDGYVTRELGFTEEDLATIKKNLRS